MKNEDYQQMKENWKQIISYGPRPHGGLFHQLKAHPLFHDGGHSGLVKACLLGNACTGNLLLIQYMLDDGQPVGGTYVFGL